MLGSVFTSPSDVGSAVSATFHARGASASVNVKAVIVRHSDMTIVSNGISSASLISTTESDYTVTFPTPVALSPSTEYVLLLIADGTLRFWFKAGDTDQGHYDSSDSYTSPADPTDATHNNNKYGIYVTYIRSAQTRKIGSGQEFDGTDDDIEVSDHTTLDFGSGDFSVSMWVNKLQASSSWDNTWAITKWNSGGSAGSNEWALTLTDTGNDDKFYFTIEDGSTSYVVKDTSTFSLDTWYHVVGVKSGTYLRIYVNGAEKNSNNIGTHSVNNVGRSMMVANCAVNDFLPKAYFDEVRVSNTARSAGWIATEYNNQSAPSSFYTLGNEESTPPTAVALRSFTATGRGDSILVKWETGYEIDSVGFHLHRGPGPAGPFERITRAAIPALSFSIGGREYSYLDEDVMPGAVYYYRLEEIDVDGKRSFHGPIGADLDGDGVADDREALPFIRGDTNADERLDLADMVHLLGYQFGKKPPPACLKTADLDDDGDIDLRDAVFGLDYLFAGMEGPPPPSIHCGMDPTEDHLGCREYPHCP